MENIADVTRQDSIILNVQRACEAAIDLAMHAVSARRLGVPKLTREAFQMLRDAGLLVAILDRRDADSDEAYSKVCLGIAEAAGAEYVVLAGWLRRLVIPPFWEGRILNIHPGLLPRFGGPGMYGLHVHRAVLDAGETESGCTVHLVDNEYDHGRTLAEASVPVLPGDTAESLQRRVYEAEMDIYPKALTDFIRETR